MTDEGGLWKQHRLLWEIGAAFVDASEADLDTTVVDAIGRLAALAGATSASVWRGQAPLYESAVEWRWVLSEGLDLGSDARVGSNPELIEALEESRGAVILPLETVVGAEIVTENGWTGGSAALVVVELDDLEVITLVVGSLEASWGDEELWMFRGFGTLLRQLLARVRAERILAYRLRLEDLVSSCVSDLAVTNGENWEGSIDGILERIRGFFGALNVAVSKADDRRIRVERSVGFELATPFLDVEVDASRSLPERVGMRPGVPEPRVMALDELARALLGDDFATSYPLPAGIEVALLPASVGDSSQAVLTVLRAVQEWLPEELDALNTIASTLGQTRARLQAESWSAYRHRIQEVFAGIAASFSRADAEDASEVIEAALAEVGQEVGADVVQLVELDDPDQLTARLTSAWSAKPDFLLPGRTRLTHPDEAFATAMYEGELAVSVVPMSLFQHHQFEEQLGSPGSSRWTTIGAPIVSRDDALAAVVLMWRGDQTRNAELYEGLLTALADMLGEFRTRVSLEFKAERQAAAQALLRDCAVEFAEASDSEFDAAMSMVLARVGQFIGALEITNWRVDRAGEQYRLRHRWCGYGDNPRIDHLRFGKRESMDRSRREMTRVLAAVDDSGESEVIHPRGDRERVHALLVARWPAEHPVEPEAIAVLDSLSRMMGQVEERLAAERYAQNAFDAAPIGIVLRDQHLRFITSNDAFISFIGAESVDELVGTLPEDLLDQYFGQLEWTHTGDTVEAQVPFRRRDGSRVWGQVNGTPIEGIVTGEPLWLIHVENVTDRRRAEQLLRFQATHDELTGLANRRELTEQIQKTISGAGSVAVLLLDIDRFKLINDSLGHDRGDELLVVIADRLRLAVRPGDLVARLGGDEFAVMLPGPVDLYEARRVTDRLLDLLGEPVMLEGQQIFPSASVGIALADGESQVEDLLRRADTAMYRAKAQGRGRHETFDEALRDEMTSRMATEAGLRRALLNHEFCVHYQPEVSLRDGRVLGAEALVRWNHPEQGLLEAGKFIAVAEDTGLVVDIGEIVLAEACREAVGWTGAGADAIISVNMAATQLQRDETVDLVADVLRESGLVPDRLCLEITESAVMADIERAEEILHRLKDLGVRLAVDDFGTGFSSLAYLRRFPVDALKIDREFVIGLRGSEQGVAFVRSMVSLAKALSLNVVAEGVEEVAQARSLLRLGCHRAQGFLLGRPAPATVLRERLQEVVGPARPAWLTSEAVLR